MPISENIFLSSDGSHTVLSDSYQVHYHSTHGAITESNCVFIEAGLMYKINQGLHEIKIFEMGFGTGLNPFLTCIKAIESNIRVHFYTVEAFPLDYQIVADLNYPELLGHAGIFDQLHTLPWNELYELHHNFSFSKWLSTIESLQLSEKFDVIFYDAFAPSSQPTLWETPILKKMYTMLNPGGILVSYCAQGAFKRNLKSAGFQIEVLAGPPGKREMTRAIKH